MHTCTHVHVPIYVCTRTSTCFEIDQNKQYEDDGTKTLEKLTGHFNIPIQGIPNSPP